MSEIDAQLEVKERLPYPQILTTTFLNLNRVIAAPDSDWQQVQTMIRNFHAEIPRTWRDKQFIKDMKAAVKTKTVDARPMFAGVPLDDETCEELGIATTKTVAEVDYFAVKWAIVNLLDRLNLLIRKEKIEYSTGINLEDDLDELGAKYEETIEDMIEQDDEEIQEDIDEEGIEEE